MNFLSMLPWIWLGLTVLLIIIEILTSGLTTIWFAAGSLVMIFLSMLKIPLWAQLIIFVAISLLLLIFTRPIIRKKIETKKIAMNSDSIIGKKAIVTQRISEFEKGAIKINGIEWTAAAKDSTVFEVGDICSIVEIQGVTAFVEAQKN